MAKGTQPLANQLQEGASILKSLAAQVSPPLEERNIFIVPGNHDLDRSNVTDGAAAILDKADLNAVQKMILEADPDWALSPPDKPFIAMRSRPIVCSVRQRIQGIEPATDRPTILTPFPERISTLALTTALIASLLRDAEARQLPNASSRVLRSIYLDGRVRLGHFPSYQRVTELITAA